MISENAGTENPRPNVVLEAVGAVMMREAYLVLISDEVAVINKQTITEGGILRYGDIVKSFEETEFVLSSASIWLPVQSNSLRMSSVVLQREDADHVDRDLVGAVDARPWLTPFPRALV